MDTLLSVRSVSNHTHAALTPYTQWPAVRNTFGVINVPEHRHAGDH